MPADLLQLKREKRPHHSTYRHILADVVNVEEIEKMSSEFLSGMSFPPKNIERLENYSTNVYKTNFILHPSATGVLYRLHP